MKNHKNEIDEKNNRIIFSLNPDYYSIEAIYAAAYVFIDKAYIYLDGDPKKEIIVFLKGKEKLGKKELENLKGEFLNELLDYLLRVQISQRNQKIREYIVGSVLLSALPQSSFSDQDDLGEAGDWQNDPLGIAVPWEEKDQEKKIKKKKKRNV
jgi:His-Xaa-Ser system protein HxsD